jgi:hypothetical protein
LRSGSGGGSRRTAVDGAGREFRPVARGCVDANPLADRIAWLIDELCRAIGRDAHQRRMEAALAWAIWIRVRLLGDRLIALAERVKGGRVRMIRSGGGTPRPAGPRAPRSRQGQRSAVAGLPQDFGWIRRLLPETTQYAGVLRYLLRDPEMAALLEKAPQARRVLRPLCHLLGVKAPELPPAAGGEGDDPAPQPAAEPTGVAGGLAPEEEAAVSVEAPPPAPAPSPIVQAPAWGQSTNPMPDAYYKRPGGLYWDGRRWQWS